MFFQELTNDLKEKVLPNLWYKNLLIKLVLDFQWQFFPSIFRVFLVTDIVDESPSTIFLIFWMWNGAASLVLLEYTLAYMAFLRTKREFVEKRSYSFLRANQSFEQILISTESLLKLEVLVNLIDILGSYSLITTITNSDAFIFQIGKCLSDCLQLTSLHIFCQIFGFLLLRFLHRTINIVCANLIVFVTFFQFCQRFTFTTFETSMKGNMINGSTKLVSILWLSEVKLLFN